MAPGHIHTQDPHIQVHLKENPKETFFVSIIGGNKNISSEVLCIRQHRFIFINLLSIQFSVSHMSFTCLFLFHVSLSILFSFKTISIFSCKRKKKRRTDKEDEEGWKWIQCYSNLGTFVWVLNLPQAMYVYVCVCTVQQINERNLKIWSIDTFLE